MTRPIAGLSEIAHLYKAMLLDQFGVLHDGRTPIPGALEAVVRLRETGTRVAIVSNSGRRESENCARLVRLGFPSDAFDAVMTSGEACHAHLAQSLADGRLEAGSRVLVIASGPKTDALAALPLIETTTPEEASLVLIAGRQPLSRSLEDDAAQLVSLAHRKVPCICSNPDETMYADGGTAPGPGALARLYAKAGGPITFIGKPHAALFETTLARLGIADPAQALMVGDGLVHDVAGAAAVGCATALVTGGIQGEPCADAKVAPTYEMARLAW